MRQQLYLPLGGVYPIPYEFEADTMPVPRGQFSIVETIKTSNPAGYRYKGVFMSQLNLYGIPERQDSTCQIAIGKHSITDALKNKEVTQGQCWMYLVQNYYSGWGTGQTHAKSYSEYEEFSGMKRSAVISCINSLIEKGWETKKVRNKAEKHGQNTPNVYQLVHHKCEPHEVPLDDKGFPKACAVPRGQGSVFQLVKDGVIHWKAALYWIISKIDDNSDWVTGEVEMSIAEAKRLTRMTVKKICAIRKNLAQVGLLEQISKPFRKFVCILFPKPYEKRRTRRTPKVKKGMRRDDEFYYSLNEKWRVSHRDGHIETLLEGTSKWRPASEFECESANKKIYADFKRIIEFATSPDYRRLWNNSAETS